MVLQRTTRLAFINIIYWILLSYIVAALIWWFIALHRQNEAMYLMRVAEINKDDPGFAAKLALLVEYRTRKEAQYIGEGLTFLVLILVGALFVYRAVRRQLALSRHQQNFMMAVTHELKTPVAIAQLNLETLQRRSLSPAQQQQLIGSSLHETQRLNELCSNILTAARFDAGSLQASMQPCSLSAIAAEAVRALVQRHPQRVGTVAIAEDAIVKGDAALLSLLLNNLLDNAVKYSPKTTLVELKLWMQKQKAVLEVTDHGPGVPVAERRRIFERFYRAGNEQTRSTKGTGLGLFLCRRIARYHQAQLALQDTPGGGATFVFTIALA